MTVRQAFAFAAALVALLLGSACGDRNAPLTAETDEPLFVQGKQLQKQGRNPEALTMFLKLIDRRGERGAPESHLESGLIYLNNMKDPVEAYHHFRKYIDLQPNSKETPYVRGMVEAARREFARTLSARPLEDQSARLEVAEEISNLRRERDELRAQLAALRGTAPVQVRSSMITVPSDVGSRTVAPPVTPVADSPITPAPLPKPGNAATATSPLTQPTQTRAQAATTQASVATSPSRPSAKSSGRTHTVGPGDTFYKLSRQYGVTVEDIAAANGMQVRSPLKLGTVLRIPSAR